jgi:hypothetical protein
LTAVKEIPRLPPDLSKPSKELDSYLATLREACTEEENHMNRYRRMRNTRLQNALTKTNVVEVPIDKRSVVICNNTLEDSSIIVEKRVGYKVTCPRCTHQWIWHGKRDRFFVSCSRCHKSFRLNWK